jgi:hypothetical protein
MVPPLPGQVAGGGTAAAAETLSDKMVALVRINMLFF